MMFRAAPASRSYVAEHGEHANILEALRPWLVIPQMVHVLLVQCPSQMITRVPDSRALCSRNCRNVNEGICASLQTAFLQVVHLLPAGRPLRLEISLALNLGSSTTE